MTYGIYTQAEYLIIGNRATLIASSRVLRSGPHAQVPNRFITPNNFDPFLSTSILFSSKSSIIVTRYLVDFLTGTEIPLIITVGSVALLSVFEGLKCMSTDFHVYPSMSITSWIFLQFSRPVHRGVLRTIRTSSIVVWAYTFILHPDWHMLLLPLLDVAYWGQYATWLSLIEKLKPIRMAKRQTEEASIGYFRFGQELGQIQWWLF